MDSVRMGVIGLGNMGKVHAAYLREGAVKGARLSAVCDIDERQLQGIEGEAAFTSSDELLASGLVDAVLIATPHYSHTTIGIRAFEAGIHVLTEKPISVHKADCERLIAAHAAAPHLRFGAMFQLRTYPVFRKIRALIDGGELGALQRCSWIVTSWFRTQRYFDSGGWRATWAGEGGGVLLNQCPHNLDLFQWFCGMPAAVRATCHFGKYHDIETEDEVTAYLEYPDGATGVFVTSTGEAPGADRLELVGDRATLVCEAPRGTSMAAMDELRLLRNEEPVSTFRAASPESFATPPCWECRVPAPGRSGGHVDITRNFVDAILHDTPLTAPGAEGIHSVELANAMLLSAWRGDTVQLPLDGAAYEKALQERIDRSEFVKGAVKEDDTDMAASFR